MFEQLGQMQRTIRAPQRVPIEYGPWPDGLVLSRQAEMMQRTELAKALNFVTVEGGVQRTRNGTSLVFSGMDGDCKWTGEANIGGTWYTFGVDSGADGSTYKLWISISGTAVDIGDLEGAAHCINHMGYLIIFDGSYAKAITSLSYTTWATGTAYAVDAKVVTNNIGYRCIIAHTSGTFATDLTAGKWEATWLELLYDSGGDGDGEGRPYQLNNRTGAADSTLALGNGTNVRIGYKFTSQAWTSGLRLKPTTVYAKLSKTLTPTGSINMVIRKQSDGSAVISDVFLASVATLTGDATEYTATFSPANSVEYLEPSTAYYLSLEYAGGDGANYVNVHCTDIAGAAGVGAHYIAAWANDTDKDPIFGLKPGRPPALAWGMAKDDRVFAIEGASGTNPAYLWYSAAGSAGNVYDWSTTDGGGYLQAIDTNANTFPLGGIGEFYDNLYLFGTQRQPYFAKLSGASPSEYSIDRILLNVYGHYNSIITTDKDIWFAHKAGIDAISTMEAYGDIRANQVSNRLHQKLLEKWDTDAFSGYDPDFGTLLVKLTDYDSIIAINTLLKTSMARGLLSVPTAPANVWEFAWSGEAPTCFGHADGAMLIGTDAGKVYKMDATVVQDNEADATYTLWTNYPSTRFGELCTDKISLNAFGKFGGRVDIRFYINGSRTELTAARLSKTLPWDTSTLPSELTMDVDEMNFLVDPDLYFDRDEINFNFRSLLVGIENIRLNGAPLYIGGMTVISNVVGGL